MARLSSKNGILSYILEILEPEDRESLLTVTGADRHFLRNAYLNNLSRHLEFEHLAKIFNENEIEFIPLPDK